MIRLQLSNNRVGVSFSGDNFWPILQFLRGFGSAVYNAKSTLWVFPIDDLDLFLEQPSLKYEVVISTEDLENNYNEFADKKEVVDNIKKLRLPAIRFNTITFNLYSFQASGVIFLAKVGKCILADQVGMGKSCMALTASTLLDVEAVLIVSPASLVQNWINEIKEKLKINTYTEIRKIPKLSRKYVYLKPPSRYLVFSYELFTRDIADICEAFKGKKILIIADEIQYIKNYSADRTKALIKFSKQATYFFGLSATYLETGLENLHSIFQVINENIFGKNIYKFYNEYVQTDYMGKVNGYKNVEKIKKKIYPYVLRRNKEEVLEQLPKRIELVYWVDLSKQELAIYDNIQAGIIKEIKENERAEKVLSAPNILAMIQYLQQACLHPALIGSEGKSSKLRELIDIAKNIDDKKIVIFCTYTKMVELIHKELLKNDYTSLYIHGQAGLDKYKVLKKFQEDDSIRFLVCSEVFREGVNITKASTIVHFNMLWNPAKIEQRTGRIDRIGQLSDKINVIYIVANKTIEIDIYARVKSRKKLYDDVVNNNYKTDRITYNDTMTKQELLSVIYKKR